MPDALPFTDETRGRGVRPYRALLEIAGPVGAMALWEALRAWEAWASWPARPPEPEAWQCFFALNTLLRVLGVDIDASETTGHVVARSDDDYADLLAEYERRLAHQEKTDA